MDCRVDFSTKTFRAVVNLCKDLGIRHPEELSLCKPLQPNDLKRNYIDIPKKKHIEQNGHSKPEHLNPAPDTNTFIPHSGYNGSNGSLDQTSGPFLCAPVHTPNRLRQQQSTPISSPTGTWRPSSNGNTTFNDSLSSLELTENLAASPRAPSPDVRSRLVKPKTLVERARMNVSWLDSSLSIMEQGLIDFDTLCLRFKYFTFFDLNPKYDQVRINQLYEQARWQILNEEIDCTEEEMLMFASLQLQVGLQNDIQQPDSGIDTSSLENGADDDIDQALSELQITLEGPNAGKEQNDITHIPELTDYLRFMKPKKFGLKSYKKYWFAYKDLRLYLFKSQSDAKNTSPSECINLRGCEVTPDINLSHKKFNIKLEVQPESGKGTNNEMWIRCDDVSFFFIP